MQTTNGTLDMATMSVADIALNFPQALEILNRYDLDYCCNGKKSFVKVCDKAGLDASLIWNQILEEKLSYGDDNRMRFDTWHVSLLIDFIVQNHHQYVRETIPVIRELLDKVCSVHGAEQTELLEIRDNFNDLAEELLDHLPKEEEILFPAIKKLVEQNALLAKGSQDIKNLQTPLLVLEHEHESAGALVKSIRALTKNYTPHAYACPTFQLAYKMLQEFDKDLMQHIHLENNILFPKVKV